MPFPHERTQIRKPVEPVNDPVAEAELINEGRQQIIRELKGLHGLLPTEVARLMGLESQERFITAVAKAGGYELRVRLPDGQRTNEAGLSRLAEALAAESHLDSFGPRPETLLAERLQVLELVEDDRALTVAKRFVRREADGSIVATYPGGREERSSEDGLSEADVIGRLADYAYRQPGALTLAGLDAPASESTPEESARATVDYGPPAAPASETSIDATVFNAL